MTVAARSSALLVVTQHRCADGVMEDKIDIRFVDPESKCSGPHDELAFVFQPFRLGFFSDFVFNVTVVREA